LTFKDGGNAFPLDARPFVKDGVTVSYDLETGMSLRDYFAAQVLAGSIAESGLDIHVDVAARLCYEMADAMLKERAK
jgi:hypothetical protein